MLDLWTIWKKGERKIIAPAPITDEEVVKRARIAVEIAIMKHKAMGVPIVQYDEETKKIYRVFSDGTREEINE